MVLFMVLRRLCCWTRGVDQQGRARVLVTREETFKCGAVETGEFQVLREGDSFKTRISISM